LSKDYELPRFGGDHELYRFYSSVLAATKVVYERFPELAFRQQPLFMNQSTSGKAISEKPAGFSHRIIFAFSLSYVGMDSTYSTGLMIAHTLRKPVPQ